MGRAWKTNSGRKKREINAYRRGNCEKGIKEVGAKGDSTQKHCSTEIKQDRLLT